MENKARYMIKDWLKIEGRKVLWLADQVQADRSTVSQWLNSSRIPHPGARARLADVTGLDVLDERLWQ